MNRVIIAVLLVVFTLPLMPAQVAYAVTTPEAQDKAVDLPYYKTLTWQALTFEGLEPSDAHLYFRFNADGSVKVFDDGGHSLELGAINSKLFSVTDGEGIVTQHYANVDVLWDFSRGGNKVKIRYKGDNHGRIEFGLYARDARVGLWSYEVGEFDEAGLVSGITYDWADAIGKVNFDGESQKAYFDTSGKFDVDPSVVGTTTLAPPAGTTLQRHTFYYNGRHWVFYTDGTDIGYRSSTDGSSWSALTVLNEVGEQMFKITVFFDGTYVHYARPSRVGIDSRLFYRRGVPNADGTITWSAAEQSVYIGTISGSTLTMCVNSGRYPFIAFTRTGGTHLYKSDTNDGTWSTQADFPYVISASTSRGVQVVPLTDNDAYILYWYNGSDTFGRLWDDSEATLVAQETATTNDIVSFLAASATAYNGTIYLVYCEKVTYDLRYLEYSGGSWGGDNVIYDLTATVYPSISLWNNTGDLRVFWSNNPTADHIYYLKRVGGFWDGAATDWITASALSGSHNPSVAYEKLSDIVGIRYIDDAPTPFNVNYAFLQDISAPTVTTSPADDITATTSTLHGEITATGGENATDRGFDWDTDTGAPYANSWTEAGDYGTGVFEHGITGLPANTTIYWIAKAQNSIEWGYSDEKTFMTNQENIPNQEPSLAILRITPTIVALFIIVLCVRMGGMSLANWIMSFVGAVMCYLIATAIIGTL